MAIFSQTITDLVANKSPQPYYRFDGSGDYLQHGNNINFQSPYNSISFWFKPEVLSGYIISQGRDTGADTGYNISFSGNKIRCFYWDTGGSTRTVYSATTIVVGKWYHIAMTISGSAIKCYINGVEDASTAVTSAQQMKTPTRDFIVGYLSYSVPTYYPITGQISDIKFFNIPLSSTEIEELYSGASVPYKYKGANQTDLMVNGNMESNSGWSDYNLSGSTHGQSTTQVHSGTYSWKVDANGGWEGAHSGTMSFVKGQAYKISGYVYREAGAGHFSLHRYNGSVIDFSATTTGATGEWEYIEDIAVAATTGSSALLIMFLGSAGVAYVDDIKVSRAGAVAEWDGSGIASDKWFDKSGNDLHLTVQGGATVENAPSGEDDGLVYEEGTWTPVLGGSGGTSGQAYDVQNGYYSRVGNVVTAWFYMTLSNKGTITSALRVHGFPFSDTSEANAHGNAALARLEAWTLDADHTIGLHMNGNGATTAIFTIWEPKGSSDAHSTMTTSHVNATTSIMGTMVYRV